MRKKGVNGRNKGANAEREAAKWLQSTFNLEVLPERNIEQYRFVKKSGSTRGMDLIGFQPFCFEVKRCETLGLRAWWTQCVNALSDEYNVPVVMYRQNNKKWQFLISAKELGLRNGFIHLEAREFVMWANKHIS